MAKGCEVTWKRDTSGNAMGRANVKPHIRHETVPGEVSC